jgi:hypothetical protein
MERAALDVLRGQADELGKAAGIEMSRAQGLAGAVPIGEAVAARVAGDVVGGHDPVSHAKARTPSPTSSTVPETS